MTRGQCWLAGAVALTGLQITVPVDAHTVSGRGGAARTTGSESHDRRRSHLHPRRFPPERPVDEPPEAAAGNRRLRYRTLLEAAL
jgi:hypothetical protein